MTEDLLEIAEHLATRGRGRPKEVLLRRALSSAYYALFHSLAFLCAEQLVGWSKPWQVFTPIYRTLEHGTAKRLLEKNKATKIFGSQVADIGEKFVLLQQWRHTADYDPEPLELGRTETLELVDLARQAVASLRMLPNENKLLLAVHLVARPR